jgi:predicted nucleotidyltransferase
MGFAAQKTPDQYLTEVLQANHPDPSHLILAKSNAEKLYNQVKSWAGNNLLSAQYSGSYAKGTANIGSSDIDIFLSLSDNGFSNHADQYNALVDFLKSEKLNPRMQNVSIRVTKNGFPIDLVPGWKHSGNTNDHSLWVRKQKTWTKTNVQTHVSTVQGAGILSEMRLTKLWREKHRIDFPSFYLELTTIDALRGRYEYGLSSRFLAILRFIRDSLVSNTIKDPANQSNIISNDLTTEEKRLIAGIASESIQKRFWEEIV